MFLKINFLHEKQKEMVQLKLKVNWVENNLLIRAKLNGSII
jgi:hypothetical protein